MRYGYTEKVRDDYWIQFNVINDNYRLFLEPTRSSLKLIASSMEQNQMTDVEFCALAAVMLFDPSTVFQEITYSFMILFSYFVKILKL